MGLKARVKATGEIVEVHTSDDADFIDRNGKYYWEHELFFGSLDVSSLDDPDYWTRLEHQYAGMAMQGMLSNPNIVYKDISTETICNHVAGRVKEIAHALVEKYKKEEK